MTGLIVDLGPWHSLVTIDLEIEAFVKNAKYILEYSSISHDINCGLLKSITTNSYLFSRFFNYYNLEEFCIGINKFKLKSLSYEL